MSVEIQHMIDDVLDDSIEHHGVKGMKWGVRRNNTGWVGPSGLPSQKKSQGHKQISVESKSKSTKKSSSSRSTKNMTNSELREQIERLQMEKQYRQLISEMTPQKHAAVRKAINQAILNGASQALTETVKAGGTKYISKPVFNKIDAMMKAQANKQVKKSKG